MFLKSLVRNRAMYLICYSMITLGIFSSTIESNILFGKDYDDELFNRVVYTTALHTVSLLNGFIYNSLIWNP